MIAFLNWLDGVLWGVPLIALMILTGLYFTVRSGFFQFRHFGWIMKRTGGKLFQKEDKASEGKGMLSSFEAISTAIGGTVGFGNIAGVATAVAAGGPGAIMWMWLSSLLGMILKQVGRGYEEGGENTDAEDERRDQPQLAPVALLAKSALHVVSRTAVVLTFFVGVTVVAAEGNLNLFQDHAEQGRKPHPHDGSRAACCDCGCNTGDVSESYGTADGS